MTAAPHPQPSAPNRIARGIAWWLIALSAVAIAAYGLAYVVIGPRMYPPGLKESFVARPWGIYPHAFFGSMALILGALQFHRGLLRRRRLHKFIGIGYLTACAFVGGAGLYMAFYAFGGVITHAGFGLLGTLLLATTSMAYREIRMRRIASHREWMIRSYALILAAVTLRIELPLLTGAFGAFPPAYQVVAWSSWVPNLILAEVFIRMTRSREAGFVASLA